LTSSYAFKPLGPAPIQDPFIARLNRANPWGGGKATGAINTLELIQDPNTKNGTLYAGSVSGGIWERRYEGASDSWGTWKQVSSFADYKGVQSISKLKITEDKDWLIAAAGAVSSWRKIQGDIQDPLQLAFLNSDGYVEGWFTNAPGVQDIIKGKPIKALEESKNIVIVGTGDGLYVGKINGALESLVKVEENNEIAQAAKLRRINPTSYEILSIAKGASGRIYASVNYLGAEGRIGGILTTTITELEKNPAKAWKIIDGSIEQSINKTVLKLATSKDPISGKDILYLGTAGIEPEAYDFIYQAVYEETADSQRWVSKSVAPFIGAGQASIHASFASDPTDPNSVFAGGNYPLTAEGSLPYGKFTGGLTAVTFNGNDAKLTEHYASFASPENADGTATHADSRDIKFLQTKTGTRIIEASDGGIGIKDIDINAPWLFHLNDGLRTTESFSSDWSNIGNLTITAMQDNALAIAKHNQAWFNVTGGDGAIARFDDAQKDNFKGYAHAYYGSQSYSSNGVLETAAYDKTGTLKYKDMLELDVLDKYGNFQDFLNYDMIDTGYNPKTQNGYPFYLPFETNNYRAGDVVLAGQRNIYEQIVPHWTLPTAGQMKLVPLIEDDIKRIPTQTPEGKTILIPIERTFTALEIGSKKGETLPKSKPYSWDALYTSFKEYDYEKHEYVTNLYGRKANIATEKVGEGTDVAKNLKLENLTSYLPKVAKENAITGISFNPDNSDQIWASISRYPVIYGKYAPTQPETPNEFLEKSYLIYSSDGGKNWETLTVSGLNGIPENAQLQQVQYVPVKDNKPAELYLGGYGGVWYATIENNGKPGPFKSVKWDGLEKGNGWNSPPSGIQDPNFSIWNTDLEYDPVDDVIVASTMGQGTWLLNRSELEAAPASNSGIRISPVILPQDIEFLKRKKAQRQIWGVMTVSLERTDENIDKNVSVDLKLDNGWEKYLNIISNNSPQFKLLENKNSITLNFAPGIKQLSFDVGTNLSNVTLPDINIKARLENPVNTVIANDSEAYVYLYANGETITMNQEAIGVFYSNKTLPEIRSGSPSQAQQLAVLMPRSNLSVGDQLFWLPVNSNGSINNPFNDPINLTLKPDNPRYLEAVNNLINNPSRHIATSTQSFDSRAFSPEKAAQAFRNPSAVLSSEGISIGDLSTSTTVQDADRFALALKDQKGNVRVSTQGFGLDQNPQLDNAINIGASGPGSQVVLAPAEGELFVADDSYFISNNASPTDRIEYNLGVARFGNYNSGYGIFRVDNPLGQFYDFNNGSFIMPGSVEYAKEAFKRSKSNGLDGITGLPIPGFGQSANHSITLATGNYYGMYITPNKVFESENSLSDLSQILFSIRTANLTSQLQHVSMGTGYFAFEDMGFAGDRDFNDMLFAITPKSQSIIG